MDNSEYSYPLQELLCLQVFSQTVEILSSEEFSRAVVAWAEREVIAGADSETLLILASLGLDSTPDPWEVDKYLFIYLHEQRIPHPSPCESTLVWLRLKLGQLIEAASASEIEEQLSLFTHYYLDYPPRAFARITNILSSLYWELYDEAVPVFNSRASEMSEHELLAYVKTRLLPYYRIVSSPDWMRLLT